MEFGQLICVELNCWDLRLVPLCLRMQNTEIAVEKLKSYKVSGIDQILAELNTVLRSINLFICLEQRRVG